MLLDLAVEQMPAQNAGGLYKTFDRKFIWLL
jgi:hypothetical protein